MREIKQIWYLCDGEKTDCKKTHCFKNEEDGCRHTSDVKHAINFTKKETPDGEYYREIIRSGECESDEKNAKRVGKDKDIAQDVLD